MGGGAEGDEIASVHDEINCGMPREAALEPSRMLEAAVTSVQGSILEQHGGLVTGVVVVGGPGGALGKGGEAPSFKQVLAACRHALKRSSAGRHHESHGPSSSTPPLDISNLPPESGVLPFGFPVP
jgi:hypothetical protein